MNIIYKVRKGSWSESFISQDGILRMPSRFYINFINVEHVNVYRLDTNESDSFHKHHLKDYYIETKIGVILYE